MAKIQTSGIIRFFDIHVTKYVPYFEHTASSEKYNSPYYAVMLPKSLVRLLCILPGLPACSQVIVQNTVPYCLYHQKFWLMLLVGNNWRDQEKIFRLAK